MNVTTAVPPTPVREAAERRFLLPQVGWQCYEALLAGIGNRRSIRVTYDRGNVELMSPLFEHETFGDVLATFVEVLLDELGIDYKPAGSTTFRREDQERGLEPDRSFYIANVAAILGRRTLDLSIDPPPDLAIEVEITRSALDRLGVYAGLGIPEVWRCDAESLFIHRLGASGAYEIVAASPTFPMMPMAEVMQLVRQVAWDGKPRMIRAFRTWIREQIAAAEVPRPNDRSPVSEESRVSYVLNTPEHQRAMLERIGAASIDELFRPIPEAFRLRRPLDLPPPLTEIELTQHAHRLAGLNHSAGDSVCFLGGGSYDHFIPSVVDAVASRSEFYTAYTPYQAEASQGSLQAFYEYQTLIAQLTAMDVSNLSMYDGGSTAAEAVLMALNITGRKGKVILAESVHPEYRQTIATYLANLDAEPVTLPTPDGFLDPDRLKQLVDDQTSCVVVQHPNFFGGLEEVRALADVAHAKGALFIVCFDPISLGLLQRPGQYGADIAVAEGQCLGNPMVYGGPYLGILACRQEYVRKIPGRLVGQTLDRNGKRCWVLTLQTREQHIRREKATSNICTNQGLFALRGAVYLAALGPQGLKETAELCLRKAHYAAEQLCKLPGVQRRFNGPFFKEFALRVEAPVAELLHAAVADGYLAGLDLGRWYADLGDSFTVAVTEKRTRAEIDGLAAALSKQLAAATVNGNPNVRVVAGLNR